MRRFVVLLTALFLLGFSSCSVNRMATRMIADALTGTAGGTVFLSDNDPELIADALPLALKIYESLLQEDPENIGLLKAAASGFISYANGFLQSPAELMPYEQKTEKDLLLKRASAMYVRGGDYAERGLELLCPGFSDAYSSGDIQEIMDSFEPDAVELLYWKASSVLGEFSIDTYNPELMIGVPDAVALAVRALELDESYGSGAIHDLLISVFANLPDGLTYRTSEENGSYHVKDVLSSLYSKQGMNFPTMTKVDQVLFHMNRSLELSKGNRISPYVSAASVYISSQDYEAYSALLEEALAFDIDSAPDNRLMNILSRRKALWLMEHLEDNFFIP